MPGALSGPPSAIGWPGHGIAHGRHHSSAVPATRYKTTIHNLQCSSKCRRPPPHHAPRRRARFVERSALGTQISLDAHARHLVGSAQARPPTRDQRFEYWMRHHRLAFRSSTVMNLEWPTRPPDRCRRACQHVSRRLDANRPSLRAGRIVNPTLGTRARRHGDSSCPRATRLGAPASTSVRVVHAGRDCSASRRFCQAVGAGASRATVRGTR